VEWEGRHDVIYVDCFDWLARLAKRNELFDMVILDPPITSVGKKKKRWSVKSDMAEAAGLLRRLRRTVPITTNPMRGTTPPSRSFTNNIILPFSSIASSLLI
jgi:hypothetical protein